MYSLSSLLPKVLQKRGIKGEVDAALVVHRANLWIQKHLPDFREEIEAWTYREGLLIISTANSIAAQECQSQSHDLLASLHTDFPSMTIEKVRIVRL